MFSIVWCAVLHSGQVSAMAPSSLFYVRRAGCYFVSLCWFRNETHWGKDGEFEWVWLPFGVYMWGSCPPFTNSNPYSNTLSQSLSSLHPCIYTNNLNDITSPSHSNRLESYFEFFYSHTTIVVTLLPHSAAFSLFHTFTTFTISCLYPLSHTLCT